ncbi:MAG: hypothetical protein AAF636_14395 [Pseudomonadota bacterium]
MRVFLAALAVLAASVAQGQDWAQRSDDRSLSRDEVVALTEGRTLVFFDEGRSEYSAGGAYSYTYASGESAFGRYEIDQEGTVCVFYRNGFSRCDRYVAAGERIVLLDERGQRFPLKNW